MKALHTQPLTAVALTAAASMLPVAQSEAANLTTFTDATAFNNALISSTTEGFSEIDGVAVTADVNFTSADTVSGPIEFEELSLVITGNPDTIPDTGVLLNPATGSGFELGVSLFPGFNEQESFIFTLPTAATGFGFNVESPNDTDGFSIEVAGETIDTTLSVLPGAGQGIQFFGFTSDTPFTTVTFTGGDELFFISDVQFGVIPEPASALLFAAGLGLFTQRRRTNR